MLCIYQLPAQRAEADRKFTLFQYAKAIPLYEQYISKNPKDYEACLRLATSYKLINDIPKAIETYKALVLLPESKADDLATLAELYRIIQQEREARQYALDYKARQPGEKADNLIASLDRYAYFMSSKEAYALVNKTQQHAFSMHSVYPFDGRLIVTAENKKGTANDWTGRSYTDLYITDASFSSLEKYAESLMTALNDGFPTFSANHQAIFFTGMNKETVSESNINTRKLQIVWAEQSACKWGKLQPFSYNSNAYSTAYPTISKNGEMLIFSSDKPGGRGGMDLYMCKKQGNEWTSPVNLEALNTYGNEVFPVFQNERELVFASNGLPGLGGLDMYSTVFDGRSFSAPQNLKAPLNSSYDDFCLTSQDGLQSGYLSSNREGSTRIDNVFHFSKAIPVAAVTGLVNERPVGLRIKVLDKYTGVPLPYVSVIITDGKGQAIQKGLTGETGTLEIDELSKGAYSVQGTLNDITTTIAKVGPEDFNTKATFIEKQVTHNDPRFTLRGLVVNASDGKPMEGVAVTCYNETSGKDRQVTTKGDGAFFFPLNQNSDFKVVAEKNKWLSSESVEATTKGLDRSKELYVTIQLSMQEPIANATIRLKKIFYAYDKCDIVAASALELDRLIKLMNDYPDMEVELSSHTDARGSDDYNLKLSQRRADAAAAYLIAKGIPRTRFTAKGYGETILMNACKNDVPCSDIQHEENRRTEFRIIRCSSCPVVVN